MTLRWHWGTKIALVYIAFAGSTIGFVVYAMRQDVDLVSPTYYEESLVYDGRQAAEARGLALGSALTFTTGTGGGSIALGWPMEARPVSGRLRLYRASDSAADRAIDLDVSKIDATGRMNVEVGHLAPGAWVAQLDWTVAGLRYYAERRLVMP